MHTAVVIPVKSFTLAKGRLADTLSPEQRKELAKLCAETVLQAAHPLPVFVVCSDPDVAQWAENLGATVVDCQTPGLDIAVTAGRNAAEKSGAEHIVVAHADLPLATSLEHVVRIGKVSVVPDRHFDGTNVLAFPVASSFTTAYGPGSFDNHVRLAALAGLEHVVINDASLELDLDTADDLGELARRKEQQ